MAQKIVEKAFAIAIAIAIAFVTVCAIFYRLLDDKYEWLFLNNSAKKLLKCGCINCCDFDCDCVFILFSCVETFAFGF